MALSTSIGRAGGTGRLAQFLARRLARFNENVREAAARHGALVVDLEPVHVMTDRRLWHADRLHLNADGHRRVTSAVLEQVDVLDAHLLGGSPGWWRAPLPPSPPSSRQDDLVTDLAWVRDHLAPWVVRRIRGMSSGDGHDPKDLSPRRVHMSTPMT